MIDQNEYDYEIVDIEDIYQDGEFKDEYVYDLSMSNTTEQTFFGNDILIHNSVYISFDEVMTKLGLDEEYSTRKEWTKKLTKVMLKRIDEYNTKMSQELYNSENLIFWDSELLADRGLFIAKKRYACHMIEENGLPCDKLLIKGLEIVRSSTPRRFREKMSETLTYILQGKDEKFIDSLSFDLYDEFKKWSLHDIALPKTCKNLGKYLEDPIKDKSMDEIIELETNKNNILTFKKGTTQHMKAAILYNHYLSLYDLRDLEPLKEDDKFKMLLFRNKTPMRVPCIGYTDYLPIEFGVDDSYLDKPRMFELGYTNPVGKWFEALGWNIKNYSDRKEDIEDLFE